MRTETKFGLLTVVVGIAWVMAEHIAGLNTTHFDEGETARMLFAFMPFVFLILGIREKKKHARKLNFLSALRTGSVIALIYSVGFSIWFWIYSSFINTEFFGKSVAWENMKLVRKGLTGQALEMAMNENTKMYGGSAYSYVMLGVSFLVMGVMGSAIIALVVRTRRHQH